MAERILTAGLKTSLLANEPYSYFHLVKFEKPRPSAGSGQTSGKATDYAYITDASINIIFDDLTKDSRDVPNGGQTYVANKLLSVGTVSETTEAKATSISLTLSGTALGTIVIANATFTYDSMTANIDLLDAGFQEGDTLLLESAGAANDGKYVRIDKFTNGNYKVLFTPIDTTITAATEEVEYTLSYASEEVNSLILNKIGSTNYSSYINREAFIYRAHMNPETGELFGEPFLIFRGIIAKGAVSDNMLTTSKVTWSLTSHWGDFVRVQGRQTSDSQHRALSITGEPDIDALIRPEYAQDPGFVHAESSVNVMAHYQTLEQKFRMRKRGGFAGFFGGQKMVEYTELVDKEIDLQFNLEAKYLPVVYGVQKVDSFPVFADILVPETGISTTTVYIAHAICEGEISGILDIHIDDSTAICLDESDSDVREGGGKDVQVVCYGRADRGFVLTGPSAYGTKIEIGSIAELTQGSNNTFYDSGPTFVHLPVNTNAAITSAGPGLQHEGAWGFSSPLVTTLTLHAGTPSQRADVGLVKEARAGNFKIQEDYYAGVKGDYWNTSHRLLDTAYAVGRYTIKEGDTTIPKLEFVVKGSKLECYNYDYSYSPDTLQPDGVQGDFLLGDAVTLHHTADDVQIGSSITIIDKWSTYLDATTLAYRFRFSENPQAISSVSRFYMKNAAGDKWYMSTYNALEVDKATPGAAISYTANTSAAIHPSKDVWFNVGTTSTIPTSFYAGQTDTFVITFPNVKPTASFLYVMNTSNQFTLVNIGAATNNIIEYIDKGLTATITASNYITLSENEPLVNDYYLNRNLVLTRYDSDEAIVQEVTRKIISYNGTTKVAKLDAPFPVSFLPNSATDKYSITSAGDKRVSINPAIQLLDYLTSTRYGKGLKHSDLNLSTFLESARYCDTRSDVIVQVAGTATVPKDTIYKYEVGGTLIFQGKVKSNSVPNAVNIAGTQTTFQEVTFTDVIGKLAYKWNNWKAFPTGYPIWNNGNVYLSTGSASTTLNSTVQSSLALTRVSGSGVESLALSITDGFSSSGNPIVKKFTNSLEGFNSPGYSLYDSDDVKYWVYLGWDVPEQRSVTRHQTNQVINTSAPLFDNINSMLIQFNGIMRYANGKYELDIKRAAPAPEEFETFQTITEADIFGELKVSDKGQKNSYNSMETSIIDPQNKFSGRSIKFFNSDYLKEDKGIRRAGNFAMPGISNYYNARINIKQYLDTSRFGLDIDFTIDSKGYLLLAGTIIQLSYPRFGWETKLFRIENLNFNTNGLVQVTASEHNDEAFLIGNIKGSTASQISDAAGGASNQTATPSPLGPSGLEATINAKGGITLTWVNSDNFKSSTHSTQVYASTTTNDFAQASLIAIVKNNSLVDTVTSSTLTTKYYWIRHVVITKDNLELASDYSPASDGLGATGSASGAIDATSVKLTSEDYSIIYNQAGAGPSPSSIVFTATSQNIANPWFKFTIDGAAEANFTDGVGGNYDTHTYTLPNNYFDTPKNIRVGVSDGNQIELAYDNISVFGVRDGLNALTLILSNETHVLPTTSAGVVTYTGVGTTIELYEGATALTYDGVGTSSGTWKIDKEPSGITVGTITGVNTNTATIEDAQITNMVADNASIVYTITGKRSNGTAINLTKTQSLAKAIQGELGNTGASVNVIFIRSTTKPDALDPSSAIPTGWSNSPPTGTELLWASTGQTAVNSLVYTWGAIYQIESSLVVEKYIYRKNSNAENTGGSYNFTTGALTVPTNWSNSPISILADGDVVYVSVGIFQGSPETTNATTTWSPPVIYSQRTDGEEADALTSTSSTTNGVTTISFSDGSSFTVNDGTPGLTKGVAAIFASNAAGDSQSYTQGIKPYVNYYEYTDTKPTLPVTGLTWVKYIGTNGDSEGVLPIYATSTTGASANLNYFTGATHVNFYEWVGTAPTTVPVDLEYVKYVGTNADALTSTSSTTNGVTTISFSDGSSFTVNDGADSTVAGPSGSSVNVIYQRTTSAPTTPDPSSTIPTNWSDDIPAYVWDADYQQRVLWASTGQTPTNSSVYTWSAPYQIEGLLAAEKYIYRKGSAGATTPTGGSYNFFTTTLTPPTDWVAAPPSITANGEVVYVSVTTFSGGIFATAVTNTWSTPAIYAKRTDGADSTVAGPPGLTKGVAPIFASNAAGDGQNYTQGSLAYVNYYEYTGTKPALPVAGLTWVKYIGTDGDSEGVLPIYATSTTGASANLNYFTGATHVNFYEWAGTAPTTVPVDLEYVKYVGADSTVAGPPGPASTVPGPTGVAGYSIAVSRPFVYYLEQDDAIVGTNAQTVTMTVTGGGVADSTLTLSSTATASSNTISVTGSATGWTVSGISSQTPPIVAVGTHTASGLIGRTTYSYGDFGTLDVGTGGST